MYCPGPDRIEQPHAITSHFAIPLLIRTPGGLLVEVTNGTDDYNAAHYKVSFFYDIAKAAVNRMAFALAHELKPRGTTAVSLTPGWLRSEAMLNGLSRPRSELAGGDQGSTSLRHFREPGLCRPRCRGAGAGS